MVTEEQKNEARLAALKKAGHTDINEVHKSKTYFSQNGLTLKCSCGHKFVARKERRFLPEVVPYTISTGIHADQSYDGSVCVERRPCPECGEWVKFAYD